MSKKHLNRIAMDMCTPTVERRPTTEDDIREDVFIADFNNAANLYYFLLDILDMTNHDVIDELGGDDTVENKIGYVICLCTDLGDGAPNILYCCVDGKELKDYIVEYESFDGLDFDKADSETLVNILLDELDYEDDDEDDWDEEDY